MKERKKRGLDKNEDNWKKIKKKGWTKMEMAEKSGFLGEEEGFYFYFFILLSRPKPGCDWHPHLPSYVSESTNLTLTFQYNINRK